MVIFAVVWVTTMGKHHLWILPNLTEDVGFFESFWPLYKHECKSKNPSDNKKKKDDNNEENESNKKEQDDMEKDQDRDSEAESVATTESVARSTNGFEMLDSNDCNEEE